MTVFFRMLERSVDEKSSGLLQAVRDCQKPVGAHHAVQNLAFERAPEEFLGVPGSPFAYWVTPNVTSLFQKFDRFEVEDERAARQGGVNGNDERWLRLWFEAPLSEATTSSFSHIPIAKGGTFSRFYCDLPLVAQWDLERSTFRAFTGLPHRPSLQPASFDFYFRPGLTWPRRTQSGLGMRIMPAGCIFADKGPAAFVDGNRPEMLLALLAITSSDAFRYLVDLQMAFGSYEVGVIQRTPVPKLSTADIVSLARLARQAWSLKRSIDSYNESPDYAP